MTKNPLKVGDKVVFKTKSPAYGATHTTDTLTINQICEGGDVVLYYPKHKFDQIALITDVKLAKEPKKPKPKATNTKIAKVRAHLLSGKSLTQLEALGLYGAFRLAARVFELKAEGMKIDTFIKEDPNGNPYAEYKLRSAKVR